jgi:hypothetical protein
VWAPGWFNGTPTSPTAWVEVSEIGHGCYARQGYEDLETIQVDSKIRRLFYYIMGRPQKVKTIDVEGRLK